MSDEDILFDLRNNGGIFNDLQKEIETLNIGFHSGRTWHAMLEADLRVRERLMKLLLILLKLMENLFLLKSYCTRTCS